MKFKAGDRVHVTRLYGDEVDFYATLKERNGYDEIAELVNCTIEDLEGAGVCLPTDKDFGPDKEDYYTLATDEEDTEEPVIQRIESLDKGEIIAYSIISNRDGDSFTSAHDMIMWLNEIEGMHGENISVKGWNLIFDHVKSSIAPAFFSKED